MKLNVATFLLSALFVVGLFFSNSQTLFAQDQSRLDCGTEIDLGTVTSIWGKTIGKTDYGQIMEWLTQCNIIFLEPGSQKVNYNGDSIYINVGHYQNIPGLTRADVETPSNPKILFVFGEKGDFFARVEFSHEVDRPKATAILSALLERGATSGVPALAQPEQQQEEQANSADSTISPFVLVGGLVGASLLVLVSVFGVQYLKRKKQNSSTAILPPSGPAA